MSFTIDNRDAAEAQRWTDRLGVDRSELLREALGRHLLRLQSEVDTETWGTPVTDRTAAVVVAA